LQTIGTAGVLMPHLKFDIAKIERLDDEGRFDDLDPGVMWEALGCPSPRVIVDIGAGTGLFARRFAAMAPGATVFAVDTVPEMLRWIEEHPDLAAGGRITPVLAQESHVPLPDASADLVFMINLHHELADPDASYRDAGRLLCPGGQMLVVDWAIGNKEGGPPQRVRAAPERIVAILETAGFVDVAVHKRLRRHWLITARKSVS
jgi:ubiquinone/menaquinone biosynthesis C-methylase UbiE